jgi:hypothetical protein
MRRKSFSFAPGEIGRKSGAIAHLGTNCVAFASLVWEQAPAIQFAACSEEARMAWLYQDPLSHNYKVCFRYRGRTYKRSLKTTNHRDAAIILGGVKRTLLRLEQNLLELPPGADILTFILSDGKQAEKPSAQPQAVTLQDLMDRYTSASSVGTMEENSLATIKMHLRHFVATLGKNFAVGRLKLDDLQRHVERRASKS